MRPAAAVLLVLALALLFEAWAPFAPVAGPVKADALTPSLAVLANRSFAGRSDPILFVVWYNLTGTGQVSSAWINLTFAGGPGASPFVVDGALTTYPGPCVTLANGSWECFGMHAGAYLWTIPATVVNDTAVGVSWNATGYAVSQVGSASVTQNATVPILIVGATVDLTVSSNPGLAAGTGDFVEYIVSATNRGIDDLLNATGNLSQQQRLIENSTATDVRLAVTLGPGLRLGSGPAGLSLGTATLTPGSALTMDLQAIVASNVSVGSTVGIHALVTYRDHGHNLTLSAVSSPVYIRQPGVLSPGNVIAAGAIALVVIVGILAVAYYLGQRRLVIDEAFLMHKTGVLIEHVGRAEPGGRDDDLVASMFVAIQEFVRDSFRSPALLDVVSFGGRRAAVVRGQHLVLAAVVSRGDVDYLFPQMVEAVRAIEASSGRLLESWDGSTTKLVGAKGVLTRFVHGGYRRPWKSQIT